MHKVAWNLKNVNKWCSQTHQ